jgi:hypothetical protein
MKIEDIIPNLMKLPRTHRIALARMLIRPDEAKAERKLSADDAIALAGVLLTIVEPKDGIAEEYNAMAGYGNVLNPAWGMNIEHALMKVENG